MNYGKKNLEENKATLKGKKKNKHHRFLRSFLKTAFVCLLLIFAIVLGGFAIYAGRLISNCPDIAEVDVSPNGFLTTVYDVNNNEIETLAASGANREYMTINDIPLHLQHAFVAIEDSRFYEHNGIDIQGIARAVVTAVASGGDSMQGASTITQQLLKNNYFSSWTSEKTLKDRIERKIQEQYLAMQLEKVMDKNTILENYLNTINLGQNTLGVEAASKRYFNKHVSELTISESAVIASITQNPSRYNPITNPDENAKRRAKVLKNMEEQGYISSGEHEEALSDDVYERIKVTNSELESGTTSYFVDALCDQVINDLIEKLGYTETEATQKLYSGGLTIHATQDPDIQKICDEEVNNLDNYATAPKVSFSYRLTVQKADGSLANYSEQTMLAYYKNARSNYSINFDSEDEAMEAIEAYKDEMMEPGDTIPDGGETISFTLQPQAAISVIDQSTGNVKGIVGGRGDKTASRTLNRATDTTRQPGSTFKIIAAYAPALDAGGMSLATAIDDSPMSYANGASLKNYDNSYRGLAPIRTGIIHSVNVMAVKTLTEIGTGLGFQYAQSFGFTTLENSDNNQSLALGGLTYGVKNIELAGAYATIANHGEYQRPSFYTTVEDYSGNVILDTTQDQPREVIKPTTAWLLTNAMEDVMTQGTGTPANFPGMAVAGKSGTTNDNRDTLFAGYTPYYTCCIWGGYDDNSKQSNTSYSKAIWKAVMSRIHEDLPYKDFEMPSGITRASICSKSGKLAIPEVCDMDPRGSMVRTEYFDSASLPSESCDRHILATICSASGCAPGPYCPADMITSGVFVVGTDPGSGEDEFAVSSDALNTTCPVHTSPTINTTTDPLSPDENSEPPNVTTTPIPPASPQPQNPGGN